MAIIFDGEAEALRREAKLQAKTQHLLKQGIQPKIAAILFDEDEASATYTRLKSEAAQRVGIAYQVDHFSFQTPVKQIQQRLEELNQDDSVSGIIIQKPWTKLWLTTTGQQSVAVFNNWWQQLVTHIATKASHGVNKDVDGLHPDTLAAIQAGHWLEQGLVLPATVRAVVTILKHYKDHYDPDFCYCQEQTLIVGRSDLLGRPLNWHVGSMLHCSVDSQAKAVKDCGVTLVGKKEFNQLIEQKKSLKDYTIIVSATGQSNLIRGEMIERGTLLIDVGEPGGDIDLNSCQQLAKFITPVPGGVGPMTVVSLLANTLDLLKNRGII